MDPSSLARRLRYNIDAASKVSGGHARDGVSFPLARLAAQRTAKHDAPRPAFRVAIQPISTLVPAPSLHEVAQQLADRRLTTKGARGIPRGLSSIFWVDMAEADE
jgi:hypothetical protein